MLHPSALPRRPLRPARRALACLAVAAACAACSPRPRAPLAHEAYVWQRGWSPEVSAAVAAAPASLGALRVLAAEHAGPERRLAEVPVGVEALRRAARPVVVVLRVDGTAPLDGLTVDAAVEAARRWQARGVPVRGLEIDHDCAAARLPAYAAWLRGQRGRTGDLPLSITALPAWLGSPGLGELLAAADGVTLQVHAVAAPSLFDPAQARRWVERWSRETRRPFAVALPTYRARLATGGELAASEAEVGGFLRGLERDPVAGLTGVAWFRLGNAADREAWGARTLAAVIAGGPLRPAVRTELVPAEGGALDVAVVNEGDADGLAPARIAFAGAVEALEGVRGYAAADPSGAALVSPAPPRLRAGERFVVGWVRGEGVSLAHP